MTDDIAARIGAMIPTCLADVVRQNRHKLAIRLPTEAEVDALRGDPDDHGRYKAVLTRWRVVTLDVTCQGEVHHILLGATSDGVGWGTSAIAVLGEGCARTENGSLYGLVGDRSEGEPPGDDLLHLCALLHRWGWGRGLGVPEWFF